MQDADLQDTSDEVLVEERIQPIHVATEYLGRYQSASHIRDLSPFYIDEPVDLGGRNSGPTALESTLAALNACTAMIMHIMRKEVRFDLRGVRFEADGFVDVRRVEMKRAGLKYSEIEPITHHFQKVAPAGVHNEPTKPEDRVALFRSEVERLCPMHALLRDASVPLESSWTVIPVDE